MYTITSAFGGLALLMLVAAGFLMMFSPARGWELLKRVLAAILAFTIGTMLLQAGCSYIRGL
jgi:hypothetical protein